MGTTKRAWLELTLVLLLFCTLCWNMLACDFGMWDTAFWEDEESISFTAKLTKQEIARVNLVGERYLKLTFDNGETYGVREEHEGQLEVGKTYFIELERKYQLWAICEAYELK